MGGNPRIFPLSSVITQPLLEPEPGVNTMPFTGILSGTPSTQKLNGPPANEPPSTLQPVLPPVLPPPPVTLTGSKISQTTEKEAV